MRKINTLLAAAVLALSAPLLAACSSNGATAQEVEEQAAHESVLTITDGWAKSADIDGMTGVFGTLSNSGDADIIITGVESDAAGLVELHEVTDEGIMQEIEGDVIVPAQGTYELAPGANHIMLMALQNELLAGDEVTFTVHYSAGDETGLSTEFTVFVKDYSGANEEYGHGDHDHGDHGDGDHADGHADDHASEEGEHGSH